MDPELRRQGLIANAVVGIPVAATFALSGAHLLELNAMVALLMTLAGIRLFLILILRR